MDHPTSIGQFADWQSAEKHASKYNIFVGLADYASYIRVHLQTQKVKVWLFWRSIFVY
jgi:hypothetical protein